MATGAGLHISISAEPIFHIGNFPVTNSIFTTWLVSAVIIFYAIWYFSKFGKVKYNKKPSRAQALNEMIIEGLYNLVKSTAGTTKKARAFFPLVATFFIFIILSNWSGLLPGFGTVGFIEKHESPYNGDHGKEEANTAETNEHMRTDEHTKVTATEETDDHVIAEDQVVADIHEEGAETNKEESEIVGAGDEHAEEDGHAEGKYIPYLRGPTADLNTTLALALFSIVMVQVTGLKFLGLEYPTKFFNFKGPIDFFVGILEIFSEISRIISFAFRLFGNIFAGEVLLAVMGFIMPLLAPLPFLGLEIFVGFIQALVFSMLTLVFLNIATISHSGEH